MEGSKNELMDAFELADKADEPARALSGGMKRRLVIARALMHRPKLLILDEPTAGVDVDLRKALWKFLRELNGAGTTILLTTHSMEEADALSDNIAIMVRGELRALGPSQTLKSTYGAGFLVTARLGGSAATAGMDVDTAFARVSEALATLSQGVKEEPSGTMVRRFEVPSADADLASIFELLNQRAADLHIVDFSVTQTTLEDVFLSFARLQREV